MSLYFVTVHYMIRGRRKPGSRQPRYLKFFQGTLLFIGLLLLLWVPLLLFSTGNPTYQTPSVVSFNVNMTLQGKGIVGEGGSSTSIGVSSQQAKERSKGVSLSGSVTGASWAFPFYTAGDRRANVPWMGVNGSLPAALDAEYTPKQLQLLCMAEDSDVYWKLTPPARSSLMDVLADSNIAVSLSFGWKVQRDLPLPSRYSDPHCEGSTTFDLSSSSRTALLDVLDGVKDSAPLLRRNSTITAGTARSSSLSDHNHSSIENEDEETSALFPAWWLLKGDLCAMRPMRSGDAGRKAGASPGRRVPPEDTSWADRWLACNVSLRGGSSMSSSSSRRLSAVEDGQGSMLSTSSRSTNTRSEVQGRYLREERAGGEVWWKVTCDMVTSEGRPVLSSTNSQNNQQINPKSSQTSDEQTESTCPTSFTGPQIIAALEKVQGGFIGVTLSRFGIIGLYSVFVYGIGRFLRLSMSNLRMRVPFEDLPSTKKLVALCQDIYIARAEGELLLEEELYNALISIYRLPTVMFELTKLKKRN